MINFIVDFKNKKMEFIMSRSLLYHAFGIRSRYNYKKTEYLQGEVYFTVEKPDVYLECPVCGNEQVIKRGTRKRVFKNIPIGGTMTHIVLPIHRLECKDCKGVYQEAVKFADTYRSYTKKFARYVIGLSKEMSTKAIAEYLGVSWGLIKSIQKNYLKKEYEHLKAKDLKYLAIDEVAIHKGHNYLTVVMDLETGNVIYASQGRKKKSLDKLWKKLNRYKKNIKAVAMDMWRAYITAVLENLPDAKIIFDRFHITKSFNNLLRKLRSKIYRNITNTTDKEVLKGTTWLLLKNSDNLNEERNEEKRLKEAIQVNESLFFAYYLKEDLRTFWGLKTVEKAKKFLGKWCAKAYASGVKLLHNFAKTLLSHRTGIFNYFKHRITTGPLEGMNNKVGVLKRRMYGFRDIEFFILKLYDLHNSKITLSSA